jgi:hypothetical protein
MRREAGNQESDPTAFKIVYQHEPTGHPDHAMQERDRLGLIQVM